MLKLKLFPVLLCGYCKRKEGLRMFTSTALGFPEDLGLLC